MTWGKQVRISWLRNTGRRYPDGPTSPDSDYLEPLAFPPPWPARPWVYANVITSKNGVVTWKRAGAHDDPVRAIAGGDFTRTGRLADLQLMRYLRACADAFSVGAQTPVISPILSAPPMTWAESSERPCMCLGGARGGPVSLSRSCTPSPAGSTSMSRCSTHQSSR